MWLFALHTDVGLQLLARGALSFRDREFAVLRIAWLCQAPYEWGEHVKVGKRFGLTSEDIARVIDGPDAAGLDSHESALAHCLRLAFKAWPWEIFISAAGVLRGAANRRSVMGPTRSSD